MAVIERKFLKSKSGYKYRPARLAPADHDVMKPWYIIFYTWDLGKEKIVRKRVLASEINDFRTREDRLNFAYQKIQEINHCLYDDMCTEGNPEKRLPGFDFHGYSIMEAIKYTINYKLQIECVKQSSVSEYYRLKACIEGFLKLNDLPSNYKIRLVNANFINRFFPYLKETRQIANNTYNARRATFHAVIQALMKKDPKLFPNGNPIADVKFLKTQVRKHAAYTDDQLQTLQKAITENGDHQLLLFIRTMIYTLARPKEVERLKIGHIRIKQKRILFASDTSKTGIEEYVGISEKFAKIIEESGVLNYPPDHYLFGSSGKPSITHVGKNYFYKRVVPYLESLGFYEVNPNYTLYSFKHTGAISLYQATKDIKLLQAQMRHQNIEMTSNYLRDLGLFRDFELLNKWEAPV